MAVDSFSDSSSEVLNDLDPLSRAILDLSLKRGMSDAEIGEILGIPEGTARSDLHHARHMLRRELGDVRRDL